MKPLVIKRRPQEKKRVENAPHWTEASTIAQRRKTLEGIHTNRDYRNAQYARRHLQDAQNTQGELDRLRSVYNMLAPGVGHHPQMAALTRGIDFSRRAVATLQQRPVR